MRQWWRRFRAARKHDKLVWMIALEAMDDRFWWKVLQDHAKECPRCKEIGVRF